ncbi:membrane-bound lytic murein transglycosylase MltF [Ketobacter nezhaii]|uniref:membrane-bound lytic murein transglycosylase MltF n=1 Tax=Ketobacter sp. MCCC 1A13808 TaxID=2602738 RepID=UPI0018DE612F|nr:membrane-bound lytic murein transglycosylase MltF [Ketobacter sp. MCCC 1A13808]
MAPIKWLIRTTIFAVTAAGFLLTPACQPALPLLEQVKEQGELIVATQTGPTTYFSELDRDTGFEYELVKAFADYMGVTLVLKTYTDLGELLAAVQNGEVHLAAAGLTVTRERSRSLRFSSPYQQITQELVYHSDSARPKELADIQNKKIVVIANSSHSENLKQMKNTYPGLRWEEKPNSSPLSLLNMVNDRQAEYVVMDSNVFNSYRDVFPELRSAFELKGPQPMAWAFAKKADNSLFTMAEMFFNKANDSGALEDLRVRFFGHREFDYVGARTFLSHLDSRLVNYEEEFKTNAKQLGLDWRLLAAIGYQESLWNPNAISPTGVRGIMMLTRRTAKEMGVTNRRNARESIEGGARYFKKLYRRLPEEVVEPNRTWFALAAYNVGYGHLMDARRLAKSEGANPDNWFDVRERLPLLRKREYYSKTRHGFARSGAQSVVYVKNIRRYYDALVWATERDNSRYTPAPQNVVAMWQGLVH